MTEFVGAIAEYGTNRLFRMTENVGSFDTEYAETALMVALAREPIDRMGGVRGRSSRP